MLSRLPAHNVAVLTGKQFFPHLISAPFHHGLVIVFTAAAIMSVTGAVVSLLRGKQFYYDEAEVPVPAGPAVTVACPRCHACPHSGDHYSERAVPHLRER